MSVPDLSNEKSNTIPSTVDMSDVWEVDNRGNTQLNTDSISDTGDFLDNWDSLLNIRETSATERNLEAQRKIDAEKKALDQQKKKVETEAAIKRKAELAARQRKRDAQKKKFQVKNVQQYSSDEDDIEDDYDNYLEYNDYN